MRTIRKHHHINKEYLIKEYIENKRSAFNIAAENGVKAKLIIERLKRFGILTRSIKESNSSFNSVLLRKNTCREKYGCDNISYLPSTIEKIKNNTDYEFLGKCVSKALKKRTKLEWIDTARKRAITFLQKYGVKNVAQLPEVRRKMRLTAIKKIQDQIIDGGQIYPRYNPLACEMIEKYGKEHGYNFQHAKNGGEYFISQLGYWVDGYDKEKNTVIEIDESYHYGPDGNLLVRDIRRQMEIEKYLKCKFIRVKI